MEDTNKIAIQDSSSELVWKMLSSMAAVKLFPKQVLETLNVDLQKEIVKKITNQVYPISTNYTKAFLKKLITIKENKQENIDESLYDMYVNIVSKQDKEEDTCYKTYHLIDDSTVVIKEATQIISCGTTAFVTWKAALVMCEWVMAQKQFENKSIMELGSGSGFLGIAAVKVSNFKEYVFTDRRTMELNCIFNNLKINGLKAKHEDAADNSATKDGTTAESVDNQMTKLSVCLLDWTSFDASHICSKPFDYILASDVCYDCDVIPSLIKCLNGLFKLNPSCKAYICTTIRNEDTYKCLKDELDNCWLSWEVEQLASKVFYYDDKTKVELLKITIDSTRQVCD